MPLAPIRDGLNLYYEDHGPRDAPAVILIRGTGADGTRWMPQVDAYKDEFRVVIFDNRGVGRSDTPAGPYHVTDMAADTFGLMAHLGIDQAHLSGSSLGGAVALQMACDAPATTLSLQLHSSWLATRGYLEYSLGLLDKLLEVGGTSFYYEAALPLLFSASFLSSDYERLQAILANMRANTATLEGLSGQIAANLSHDLSRVAGDLDVPALVTVGELDVLTPVAAAEELAEVIPGAELVVFSGGSHLVTMESPKEFNEVTLQWLRKVDSNLSRR